MDGITTSKASDAVWVDDLHLLDDRAGPPVRDDEWQRILMFRTHMDEMDVEPIYLGDELR